MNKIHYELIKGEISTNLEAIINYSVVLIYRCLLPKGTPTGGSRIIKKRKHLL